MRDAAEVEEAKSNQRGVFDLLIASIFVAFCLLRLLLLLLPPPPPPPPPAGENQAAPEPS
jgi:hypothetical protein